MPRGGARPGAGRKPAPCESLQAARRRKESSLADLRGLEVEFKRGELVNAREVEKRVFELIKATSERIQNWPADIAGRLAARLGVDAATLEVELETEVRTLLASMTARGLTESQGEPRSALG
jgi:hypothetical protein